MRNIRHIFLFALCLSTFVPLAFSQITINSAGFPAVGTSFMTYSTGTVTIDLGNSGPNKTWDFTGYEFYENGITQITDPGATAFVSSFPNATHAFSVLSDPVIGYAYLNVTGSAAYLMGYAGLYEGDTLIRPFVPAALAAPFPLNYQSSWSTVMRFSRIIQGHTLTYVDSTLNIVDAWGDVVTELGTFPVLRILEHTYSTIYAAPLPPQTTEDYSYTMMMQNGFCGADIANAEGTSSPNFTQATIEATLPLDLADIPTRGPVARRFNVGQNYPNPFNPVTTLPIELTEAGKVEISVFDETGRLVSSNEFNLTPGQHNLPLNGSQWSSGTYFARIAAEHQNQTVKMQLLK